MTKSEFKQFVIENSPVMLDGATGSNLQKKGMAFGVCPEKWITENEDALIELQREYIQAGSNIIYAPTFGGNSIKLKEYGLESEADSINRQLVKISRQAAQGKALVAGDITMCGQTVEPLGSLALEDLIECYENQVKSINEAGADLIVIETMMSLQETRAAVIAAKNICELPIMVTMTFSENGKTLYGTDAATAAIVLDGMGVDAVGMNCSAGPDKMQPLVDEMIKVTNLPIVAKPNAGIPVLGENSETVYDMPPITFAGHMKNILESGAAIVGGCCGTDPEYISKTKEIKVSVDCRKNNLADYVTSEREKVAVLEISSCLIDTQNNEDIRDELAEDEFDTIYDLLDEMEDNDENVVRLRLNYAENKLETIKNLLFEITANTTKPICFELPVHPEETADGDSSGFDDKEIMDYALKNYCGRAGVIIADKNDDRFNSIIKKYGAIAIYE